FLQACHGAAITERRVLMAVRELQVLTGELDVHQTAATGLEIVLALLAGQLVLDLVAHGGDGSGDLARALAAGVSWCVAVDVLRGSLGDLGAERWIAGHGPELDECLALPEP